MTDTCRSKYTAVLLWSLMWLTWRSATAEAADELLRWKLKAGESLRYTVNQISESDTAGAGKPLRLRLETTLVVTWQVRGVDPQGTAEIEQKLESLRVSLQADRQDPVVYDSTSKNPPVGAAREIAAGVSKLLGVPSQLRLTSRGQVEGFTLPAIASEASPAANGTTAAQNPTADQLTKLLRQALVPLPEGPLTAGGTWNGEQELAAPPGTLRISSRWTAAGPAEFEGRKLEHLKEESQLTAAAGKEPTAFKVKEGTQTGAVWFDREAGRLAASQTRQVLVTERPYRGFTITVRTTSDVQVRKVE